MEREGGMRARGTSLFERGLVLLPVPLDEDELRKPLHHAKDGDELVPRLDDDLHPRTYTHTHTIETSHTTAWEAHDRQRD